MASEGDGLNDTNGETLASPEPTLEEGASPEFVGDPQEMWIEEYEREGRRVKPRKEREEPRRLLRWIVLVAVIIVLVVWTLISPSVMPVSGTTYTESEETANLGSEAFTQNVRIASGLISVGATTWAISMSGDPNATVDEDAVFQVMVSKMSEDNGGFWFKGTDISLRNVSFYTVDDALIGWMTDKEEESDRSIGEVHAIFTEPGIYDCHVTVKFSVYEIMRIGFLPADKVLITVGLSDLIVVSERAEPGSP